MGVTRRHVERRRPAARPGPANDAIDLRIGRGEALGLLGHNGAGKTTLIRQIACVLRPDAGRIDLFGHDVTARPALAPLLLAYLAQQEPALDDLPVRTAIETSGRLRGLGRRTARSAAEAVMDELALDGLYRRPLRSLSGGQRRLAEFGTALIADRPLLLLDEPTAGLDAQARNSVWEALRRRKPATTMLIVTHDIGEAQSVLDRTVVLRAGRALESGRAAAVVADAETVVRLAWAVPPPDTDPDVRTLRSLCVQDGLLWTARTDAPTAKRLLAAVLDGPAAGAVADVSLNTAVSIPLARTKAHQDGATS